MDYEATPLDAYGEEAQELAEWMGDTDHALEGVTFEGTDLELDSLQRQHYMNILLWRVGNAERKMKFWRRQADGQIAHINAWFNRRIESWVQRTAHARTQIDGLMRDEHRANPKTISLDLPNGKVTYRQAPVASCIVDDEDAAVAWLEATGHAKATETKVTVKKSVAKKLGTPVPYDPEHPKPGVRYFRLATDEGEVIPGIHLEREADDRVNTNPR